MKIVMVGMMFLINGILPLILRNSGSKSRGLLERGLSDRKIFSKRLAVGKHNMEKTIERFASTILEQAKRKGLKIKKVQVGKNVKTKIGGERGIEKLTSLLNKKNFLSNYKKKIQKEREKKRRKLIVMKAKELEKRKAKAKKRQARKMPNLNALKGAAAVGGAGNKPGMDFNYLPNFGGIPFPPVAVGGINYHAPMKIKINTLPYPNPRAYESPYSHANRHLKLQEDFYNNELKRQIEDTNFSVNNEGESIKQELNKAFSKVTAILSN